jgi:peroxiredoxin
MPAVRLFSPPIWIVPVLALGLSACSSAGTNVEAAGSALKPAAQRKPAPDFTLEDSRGEKVKLSSYRGKVVLLDFWATWCGPCKIEIPWFMEFEQELKPRGLVVLGVSMDDDGWSVVRPYIEQRKINYRILLGNDQVAGLYGGVDAMPTTFLIDRSGRIAAMHQGLSSKDDFKNEILQLLDARAELRAPFRGEPALLTASGAR